MIFSNTTYNYGILIIQNKIPAFIVENNGM